jgi:hypothetical protein
MGCGDDGPADGDASVPADASVCVDPVTDCFSPAPCHQFECVNQACVDVALPAETPCGDATDDACNKPDTCDGSGSCVANFVGAGDACGSDSVSECDGADSCDGNGNCASNAVAANTACGDPTVAECNGADVCDGNGSCSPNFLVGLVCGDPTDDICNLPDTCNAVGVCAAAFAPPGTICGNPSNTDCDRADSCDGAGLCSENIKANGFPCGNTNTTECDGADSCNGAGTCLPNFFVNGTSCGDATSEDCNAADTCNGSGTCLANLASLGSPCGIGTTTECDLADTCNAIGDCLDNFVAVNTACGDGSSGPCDAADDCNGTGACRDNNVADGTACNDGNNCTSASECLAAVCEPTVTLSCEALWCFDNGGFTLAPNVGQGTVIYGAGLAGQGNAAGNTGPTGCPAGATLAMDATSWNAGSYAAAAAARDCYEFSVATGLDPLVLSFDNLASGTGPTTFGVEVQADAASATDVVVTNLATSTAFSPTPMRLVSLDQLGIDAQAGALVRICGFGASSAAGTWAVDNVRVFTGGCNDGVENADETDIDCGGPLCPACPL